MHTFGAITVVNALKKVGLIFGLNLNRMFLKLAMAISENETAKTLVFRTAFTLCYILHLL